MNKFHPEIKKQRRSLISTGIIFHHDNVPAHTSFLVSSTIDELKYEFAPYSSDLMSSDLFLFKEYLKRRHYNDRSPQYTVVMKIIEPFQCFGFYQIVILYSVFPALDYAMLYQIEKFLNSFESHENFDVFSRSI